MANVELEKSVINYGSAGDIIIGDNNDLTKYSNESFDFDSFSKLLGKVLIESDNRQEREYAAEAKEIAKDHDKKSIKEFIKARESAFTSGTFATVAGGVLLALIDKVLHF